LTGEGADWSYDLFQDWSHAVLPWPTISEPQERRNYYDVDTGEDYWISGSKRAGGDALYGGGTPIKIDEDVREEYWRDIRQQPDKVNKCVA
jgi:hypothetical protein